MTDAVYADAVGCQLIADPDPNAPAGSIALYTLNGGGTSGARFILSTTRSKVGLSQRLWMPAVPDVDIITSPTTSCSPVLQIRDVSNNVIATLGVRANAAIVLIDGAVGGTMIAQTPGPVITANAWWHIEVSFDTVGANTVAYEVRVEGVNVLSGTGAVTNNSDISQVLWGLKAFSSRNYNWKDIVCWDSTGSYNTNFIGSVSVVSLTPTSDVNTGWTPSTGTLHYPLVDNSPPVDATDYVTAPFPLPTNDQYGLSNLPLNVTSVKGVMTYVRARKTDGGDGNLQVSMVSGASVGNGVDRPITAAYAYWRDLFETNPATSAPWIPGAVDAAQLRINRTL